MNILSFKFSAYDLGRLTGILLIGFVIYKLIRPAFKKKTIKNYPKTTREIENTTSQQGIISINYKNNYEPKYLMTLNEKDQFKKIQYWAQRKGLLVFTKVRLLDLITPRKDQDNYQGLLWKIQAKHVDFVICDTNIKVKCIIEINDNSHKESKRTERDKFVTEVLEACGYKVLQSYNVTDEQLDKICGCNKSTTDGQNRSI